MRQAQIRRSHADTWNTTAKLVCSFTPSVRVQEDPGASLMDFAYDSYYQPGMHLGLPAFAPLGATNLWTSDTQIRRQFEGPGTHQPDVFTLPRDHSVAQQFMLVPCEDLSAPHGSGEPGRYARGQQRPLLRPAPAAGG